MRVRFPNEFALELIASVGFGLKSSSGSTTGWEGAEMSNEPEILTFPQMRRHVAGYVRKVAEVHNILPIPCSPYGPVTDVERFICPRSADDVHDAFYEHPDALLGFCTGPRTGLALLVDNSTAAPAPQNALHIALFSGTEHAVSEIKLRFGRAGTVSYANTVLLKVGPRFFGQGIDTSLPAVEFAPDGHWGIFSPCAWSVTDVPHYDCSCFVKNRGPATLLSVGVRSVSEHTMQTLLCTNSVERF